MISAANSGVHLSSSSSRSEAVLRGQMVHTYLQDVTAALGGSRTGFAVSHHPHLKCRIFPTVPVPVYLSFQIVKNINKQ